MFTHEDIIKSLEVGNVKFIGVTEVNINEESKNVIIKFEGTGGKFTYEQLKGYKNVQFECSVKEKDGELWNGTILDGNDPFYGDSDKLYKHIVKSSMNLDKCSLYPELISNKEIEMEEVNVSKYKVGDKVVIRKDLEVGGKYGELSCFGKMISLKEKDYVVIKEVDGGYYWIGDFFINDEMIEGLYEEKKDMTIEDLKKQIDGYFSNLIDDFKGELKKTLNSEHLGITLNKDMVNEAFMINVKEKENRVNELVLKILELNHDIKLSIGGK